MGTKGMRRCNKCCRFFLPDAFQTHFYACTGKDESSMIKCPKCEKLYWPTGYPAHIRICKGKIEDQRELESQLERFITQKIHGSFIVADSCFKTVMFADNIDRVNEIVKEIIGSSIGRAEDIIVYEIAAEYAVHEVKSFNLVKKL